MIFLGRQPLRGPLVIYYPGPGLVAICALQPALVTSKGQPTTQSVNIWPLTLVRENRIAFAKRGIKRNFPKLEISLFLTCVNLMVGKPSRPQSVRNPNSL